HQNWLKFERKDTRPFGDPGNNQFESTLNQIPRDKILGQSLIKCTDLIVARGIRQIRFRPGMSS
ncbi:hypothetical protein ABHI18_012311, partial [Aspergillus niger]